MTNTAKPPRKTTRRASVAVSPNGSRLSASLTTTSKTYKLDQYRAECDIEPFVLDTGADQIVIAPPTGEVLLQIAEAGVYDVRKLMELLCRDQYEVVWAAVKDEDAGVVVNLMRDLVEHFMIGTLQGAPGGLVALPN